MLIILAEALREAAAVARSATRSSASRERIAADQKKLRRTVGDIVFTRLGGDPSGEEQATSESPDRAKTMEEMLRARRFGDQRSTDPIDFEGGREPGRRGQQAAARGVQRDVGRRHASSRSANPVARCRTCVARSRRSRGRGRPSGCICAARRRAS